MTPRLVLDAGGVLALARRDRRALEGVALALTRGALVVIPTPVIAQVHRGGHAGARVDAILRVSVALPTSDTIARAAGELLGASGQADAIDAIVVAEALFAQPALIMTSDPGDLRALIAGQADRARVAIMAV